MKVLFSLYRYDYDRAWRRTHRENGSAYEQWYIPLERMLRARDHTLVPFWIDEAVLKNGYGKAVLSLKDTLLTAIYGVLRAPYGSTGAATIAGGLTAFRTGLRRILTRLRLVIPAPYRNIAL